MVSVHHGGGVGIGYSLHAGMVISPTARPMRTKLERVLTCDPGMAWSAMPMPDTLRQSRQPSEKACNPDA